MTFADIPRVLSLLPAATVILAGSAYPQGSGAIRFTNVTDTAGVALPGLNTESVAGGDYDNDGDEDHYLTNDGPNRLFRNDGEGRFTDVTAAAGVGSPAFSVGAAFGDLDNDGDLDLYGWRCRPPSGPPSRKSVAVRAVATRTACPWSSAWAPQSGSFASPSVGPAAWSR